MRIVLASAWYPVGVGAYLLRAARRIQAQHAILRAPVDRLEIVTVGPTSGSQCWAPEFQYPKYAIKPDFKDAEELFIAARGSLDYHPDLWIDVDGGYFTQHRMPRWPHAIVATDPHISEQGGTWTYEKQREIADFFFCMQKPYLLPNVKYHYGSGTRIMEATDGPGLPELATVTGGEFFLPYAYDPEVFHRYPDQKEDADVTVLGMPYPKRQKVAEELTRRGFRVLAGIGSVYEEYARDLCRAPVCFIWSLKDDVPCRVFEAAACGRAIVINHSIAAHVLEILPGLQFADFGFDEASSTEAEMVLSACHAVEGLFVRNGQRWRPRDNQATLVTSAAAVEGHTWDARLRQIVKTCLGKEI